MIRVMLADDQAMVRGALAALLALETDIEVVAQVGNGNDVLPVALEHRPDVVLMDIQMPGGDGLSAAERILAEDAGARIVFLTTFSDDEYIVRALKMGARGYLIKQDVARIAPALRSVMAGVSVLAGEKDPGHTPEIKVKKGAPVVNASENPTTAQLWPHVHGTDAMFLALLRKN